MNVTQEAVLARLKEKGTYLASLYLVAHHKLELLKPMVFDDDLVARFSNTTAVSSFERLRFTLLCDLIKDLVEITLYKDLKSPSIARLVHELKDAQTRNTLRNWYGRPIPVSFNWPPDMDRATQERLEQDRLERRRQGLESQFDECCAQVSGAFDEISKHPLSQKFTDFRNNLAAHYAMTPPNQEPRPVQPDEFGVKWGDPEIYLQMIEDPVFKMVLITTGASWDVDEFKQSHVRDVRSFWRLPE